MRVCASSLPPTPSVPIEMEMEIEIEVEVEIEVEIEIACTRTSTHAHARTQVTLSSSNSKMDQASHVMYTVTKTAPSFCFYVAPDLTENINSRLPILKTFARCAGSTQSTLSCGPRQDCF